MKVALLYPYVKNSLNGCDPPISVLYLAAALQQAGQDVTVIDADDGQLSNMDIAKKVAEYGPDLVGMPLFSARLPRAYKLVELLDPKTHGWRIVLGGPHATARPEEVLKVFDKCDYVLRSESDRSLLELVECLNGRSPDTVMGLSYRDGDKIIHNPDAPLIRDLDTIPLPARELLADAYDREVYWRLGHRGITDVVITSRGCPYRCNFCFQVSKKFRARSPENILEELVQIRSRGIKNVHILDDLFVFNKPRCLKILEMIREQKLGMEFKVRARVDRIDEELLVAMKESGVVAIVYGIESGSQKILDNMNKRTTVEMNYKAIEMTKKAGLQCYADVFIGYLGETPETIAETEDLLLKARPTAVNLGVMYPLPSTTVYDQAAEQGVLIGEWDVKGTRPWIKLPWIDDLRPLFKIRHRIHRKYMLHPVVIFNAVRLMLPRVNLKQFGILVRYFFTVLKVSLKK